MMGWLIKCTSDNFQIPEDFHKNSPIPIPPDLAKEDEKYKACAATSSLRLRQLRQRAVSSHEKRQNNKSRDFAYLSFRDVLDNV